MSGGHNVFLLFFFLLQQTHGAIAIFASSVAVATSKLVNDIKILFSPFIQKVG